MRYQKPLSYVIAAAAAITMLMNASSASAQAQGGGQGRRGGAAMANFSEEQRTALQEMRQETREQSQKVAQARTELNGAVYAEKVDEAAIKEKSAALAKAEEELSLATAKAFAKVRSKFGTEQIDALKRMGGGRGPGGGAGGGRRGGAGAGQ